MAKLRLVSMLVCACITLAACSGDDDAATSDTDVEPWPSFVAEYEVVRNYPSGQVVERHRLDYRDRAHWRHESLFTSDAPDAPGSAIGVDGDVHELLTYDGLTDVVRKRDRTEGLVNEPPFWFYVASPDALVADGWQHIHDSSGGAFTKTVTRLVECRDPNMLECHEPVVPTVKVTEVVIRDSHGIPLSATETAGGVEVQSMRVTELSIASSEP